MKERILWWALVVLWELIAVYFFPAPPLAAPKTFDDYLGWTAAILVFLAVLGYVIKTFLEIFSRGIPLAPLLFLTRRPLPAVPMLLICGDEGFCEADENQLQRARINYRKLENATLAQVEREIQRRRLDGTLYQWVHIAAHGNDRGFALGGAEMMTTEWVTDHLEGVKVVFCASCDSVETGDGLSGIVDAVVVVYGKRGSGLISTFAFAFWREMVESGNPRRAFRLALLDVPQLRPFVDLQMRRP